MFFVDVLAKGAIYYVQHQILHGRADRVCSLYAFIGRDLEQREYVLHTKQYDSDHALYKTTLSYFFTAEYVNSQSKMQLK